MQLRTDWCKNLQLVGGTSQPQDTADNGKVTLKKFQFVRRLGEVPFGTVVLAKRKLTGGPEELYALKAIKNEASLPAASVRFWPRRKP
jgi:hypothetical protein